LSYFDPSDAHNKNVKGEHTNLVFHVDITIMNNINDISQVNMESFYYNAFSTEIDYEKLSLYFIFLLDKSTIHYPMRRHLKSRFQILRSKRLNEAIVTDTYFANEKSVEGYHSTQEFFGRISKILYVAGTKAESDFDDVC
jgi:hypothetical protein